MLKWRRGSESNRRRRLCRPLHDHSATPPSSVIQLCSSFFLIGLARRLTCFAHSALTGRSLLNDRPKCIKTGTNWSGRRVSNSRPQPWQGCALPTELLPRVTEPTTIAGKVPCCQFFRPSPSASIAQQGTSNQGPPPSRYQAPRQPSTGLPCRYGHAFRR
jgi:hypothetical protein